MSTDKRSEKYILEFREQLKDINTDFLEGISSDDQKIGLLITGNEILKNNYFGKYSCRNRNKTRD